MKRIGILTAGGDTPALNATIHGAVVRANQRRVEVYGLTRGYGSLLDSRVSYVHLNPLFRVIPELDATRGGTILGGSRDYIDPNDSRTTELILEKLGKLAIEGLVCVGGDGTLNAMQPIAERIPAVLAPKTIDNDLGLNYTSEPDEWARKPSDPKSESQKPIAKSQKLIANSQNYTYERTPSRTVFHLENMINYVTPGYATSVFVSTQGVGRVRTTAESHRRIAIIEVMGRHSGYIALGSTYGRPDIVLVPEYPLQIDRLVERVKEIYDLQQNAVIVCGEGIVDESGRDLGDEQDSTDPAGNRVLSGASEALRRLLIEHIGDEYFRKHHHSDSAEKAIFTRKVGHTQRGGRPILFDSFHAAQLGGKAVDILLEGSSNAVAILQWNPSAGFFLDSFDANSFRDRWGLIHARSLHPSFYDPELMKPSELGIEYLLPIFTGAVGNDDVEYIRQTIFKAGNLTRPYHSVNTDINKRIKFLD